jgi:hypothetical protein
MTTKKEWNNMLKPYGYQITKIWFQRVLIILSIIAIVFIVTKVVIAETSSIGLNLPKFFTIELKLSNETLDNLKGYINMTIDDFNKKNGA